MTLSGLIYTSFADHGSVVKHQKLLDHVKLDLRRKEGGGINIQPRRFNDKTLVANHGRHMYACPPSREAKKQVARMIDIGQWDGGQSERIV